MAEEKEELLKATKQVGHSHEEVAKAILKKKNLRLDAELEKRFLLLVDSRLRDARTSRQTYQQLEDVKERGGLGFKGAQLSGVMELIEKAFDEEQGFHHTQQEEKKQVSRGQMQEQKKDKQELVKKEEQLLAKRYTDLTGKAPMQQAYPVSPSGARHTGAISAKAHLERQEERIDTQKVRRVIEAAKTLPAPKKAVHSSATITPAVQKRPKVQDIHFSQQLAGPLEELQRMSLADFRRLGATPAQASVKIHDKIALLAERGEKQRIAAVQAWRQCPLYHAYVVLAKDAVLSGKTLFEHLEDRQHGQGTSFSKEELGVIMDLNASLRY